MSMLNALPPETGHDRLVTIFCRITQRGITEAGIRGENRPGCVVTRTQARKRHPPAGNFQGSGLKRRACVLTLQCRIQKQKKQKKGPASERRPHGIEKRTSSATYKQGNVMPAKAGIQFLRGNPAVVEVPGWIPACAGMTIASNVSKLTCRGTRTGSRPASPLRRSTRAQKKRSPCSWRTSR